MRFLSAEFPALTDQYGQLYASKYVPKDYAERVKRTVGMLKARYGLAPRQRRGETTAAPGSAPPAPAQATLWS
jgi:hypothetical protein